MKHPNASILEKIYADFARGDIASVLKVCDEKMTFQIAGKSKLAGKYDRSNFESGFFTQLKEMSGGSFQSDVHDILASDLHAAVLATQKLTRHGKPIEYRTVHIWRFQGGKPVAWYEYPRDLYQYDSTWS
jgi:ketosteroid isomerase-like protein